MQQPQIDSVTTTPHLDENILERYALGVLQADLTPAVDEHLLCCPTCQLRLAETDEFVSLFRDAATEVLEAPLPERRRWTKFFALPNLTWAGAMAVALIAAGLFLAQERTRQIAHRAPAIVLMQSLRGPEAGAADPGAIVAARTPLKLQLDVPPRVQPDDCRIEVVDLHGTKVVEATTALVNGRLEASALSLKPGGYWVRLYRKSDGELLVEYSLHAREN